MKKIIKNTLAALLLAVLFISCSGGNKAFQKEFEETVKDKQGEELLNTLITLDEKYEDKLILKVNLSALYMSVGDIEKALPYLNEGLPLAEKSKIAGDKYMFYTKYAEYKYTDKKYDESEKYARLALDNTEEDFLGVSLILAKTLAVNKKYNDAYLIFKDMWKTKGNLFNEEDITYFISVLGAVPSDDESLVIMITLLDEMKVKSPSAQGIGLKQAEILEQAGAPLSALIAIFSEVESARYTGMMDNAAIEKNLNALSERFRNPELKEKGTTGLKLIEGYINFINERWEFADAVFTELAPEIPITFYYYLKLAARIETGMGSQDDFTKYVSLERNYAKLQGFYYHFWRGLKKGVTAYTKEVADPALRGCIMASPFTRYALESRIELASLNGIENGENILLPEELYFFYQSILNGAPIEILESVAVFLSMEDNIFVSEAMALLKNVIEDEKISNWFKAKGESTDNQLLKERISSLLS